MACAAWAKYIWDHGISHNNPQQIETGRGVLTLHLHTKAGKVERVTVDMGEPTLEAERIPTTLPGPRVVDRTGLPVSGPPGWEAACGFEGRVTCVSMGNPHVVLYCAHVAAVPLEQVGPALEKATAFPKRIKRPLRGGSFARRSHDANVGTRQRHYARLWYGSLCRRRRGCTDRSDVAGDHGPPAGRRFAVTLGRGRQPRSHDRSGRGSLQRRVGRTEGPAATEIVGTSRDSGLPAFSNNRFPRLAAGFG